VRSRPGDALQEYRQLDDPKFKPKSLWFSPTENSKPVSSQSDPADHQLEKRVDAELFKVQIIIAVLVAVSFAGAFAIVVMLALD
jgi:hypothetical protein